MAKLSTELAAEFVLDAGVVLEDCGSTVTFTRPDWVDTPLASIAFAVSE